MHQHWCQCQEQLQMFKYNNMTAEVSEIILQTFSRTFFQQNSQNLKGREKKMKNKFKAEWPPWILLSSLTCAIHTQIVKYARCDLK